MAVDPDEDQWELTIDFPLSTDAATLYYLELALISETEGVQTVEWSARTSPVAVTLGVSREVRQAEVVRGPVDNLAVTALLLTGPETVPEGESFVVTADVAVSDATAEGEAERNRCGGPRQPVPSVHDRVPKGRAALGALGDDHSAAQSRVLAYVRGSQT